MGDGFGFFVLGVLDDLQVFTWGIDALVMTTVNEHVGAEKGMEKRTRQVISRMLSIFFRLSVQTSVGYFPDRATEIKVDELHAFADAENRFLLFIKQMKGAELFQVKTGIGAGGGPADGFLTAKIR